MSGSAISCVNVAKTFRGGKRAVAGLSFDVGRGEMVALIGPSGSGKSTLIRLIAGLERADRGGGSRIDLLGDRVQQDGRRIKPHPDRRACVSVVFQRFNLVGRLSLLTNVLTGALGRAGWWRGTFGLFARDDKITALKSLERVGMLEYARQRASTLSGGQQQRGAIARALTQQADIILADEPVASLDPAAADNVMQILSAINRDDGVTVVVSLHQVEYALKYCDRIVALKGGHLVHDGPSGAVDNGFFDELYGGSINPEVMDGGVHAGHDHRKRAVAHAAE